MPATLKDVADLAKVSLTTASHALNGKKVSEEARERVLEAAKKLHYYVNISGRNLITNKRHAISLVVLNTRHSSDFVDEISYYYELLKGAMACAQESGYTLNFESVIWENIQEDELFEKKIFGRAVDGVIVIPQFMYRCDFISMFESEKFPYVIINPGVDVNPVNRVLLDNYKGGRKAAEYLAEMGHKRILFINGPKDHVDAYYREKGFMTELLHRGIKFDRRYMVYSDFTHLGGYYTMKRILSDNAYKMTAVFCANDYMATGVMSAVHEAGLAIPKDLSVMGYDGMDISACVFPKLATISSEVRSLGYEATKRLIALINGQATGLSEIVLKPVLLERNSVGRA